MNDIPVHVWLPDQAEPTRAGWFHAGPQVSAFHYADDYRGHHLPALAPDMPVTPAGRKITGKDPIFPVFMDGGPDDWGRLLLERKEERPVSNLEALTLGPADGAGSIVLGGLTPDRFEPLSIDDFERVLAEVWTAEDEASERHRERVLQAVIQGTSLGGAKPKLTLLRDGVQYIAKFPDRGDDPYLPHLELAMLRMARACGIDACEGEIIEPIQGRYALLVKRFDRHAVEGGMARKGYVSAWSVLRLDQNMDKRGDEALLATRGYTPAMHARSYVQFAVSLMRWCGNQERLLASTRELWRRIVFNTLIRNTDDHPRNHGLICDSMAPHQWRLSPAFDLVAQRAAGVTPGLSMAYLFDQPTRGRKLVKRRLVSAASRADLVLAASTHYGYQQEEAERYFEEARALVRGTWRQALIEAGMPADETERYRGTLGADFP